MGGGAEQYGRPLYTYTLDTISVCLITGMATQNYRNQMNMYVAIGRVENQQ